MVGSPAQKFRCARGKSFPCSHDPEAKTFRRESYPQTCLNARSRRTTRLQRVAKIPQTEPKPHQERKSIAHGCAGVLQQRAAKTPRVAAEKRVWSFVENIS